MRFTGSFQTIVCHGGSTSTSSSGRSSTVVAGSAGAESRTADPGSHPPCPTCTRMSPSSQLRRGGRTRPRRVRPYAGRMTSGTALMTDRYELTMLDAALADGTAHRRCTFEVFARSLPHGRRYGVVAGVARLIEALGRFGFGDEELDTLRATGISDRTLEHLASTHFGGEILGYPEGELYFPGSPILSVTGTFAECVLLETLVLSILNHDCAIASAAARMRTPAAGRRAGSSRWGRGARTRRRPSRPRARRTWPGSTPRPTSRPPPATGSRRRA